MKEPDNIGWSLRLREWRHNPCLMRPVTAVFLLILALFWLTITVLKFPALVLGIFLSPIISRFQWVIEFWYPTAIGKFLHMSIVRIANRRNSNDANKGFHSRATETRIEIVPGRVFIHPLPQLLDNLGYLVVCIPTENEDVMDTTQTDLGTIRVDPNANAEQTSIVAFVIDCGDADAVAKHISLIQNVYYNGLDIHLQSVLSTHKHHDHTAGNHAILNHPDLQNPVKLVFGGAVENVPACNFPLKNGDKLPLPKAGDNDMNDLVEVEAVATPAHTRGSLTYILRPKGDHGEAAACLFTGDTVFSAGGGVPFEADIDAGQEERAPRMTANAYIKASASMNAVERCFAEVLYRSAALGNSRDGLLIFPGHEYTNELLTRQMTNTQESCRWKNYAPATFFETVSQMYISLHRRTLPHSSGKLMTVPSPLSRELYINPQFRSLKQRGVVVTAAIRIWHRNFAKQRVKEAPGPAFPEINNKTFEKTRATENQWNLSVSQNINAKVFTTVYSADLDNIIEDLGAGKMDASTAANRLKELKIALEKPIVGRRPIPGTLPSSRMVYRGLLGLALLGSSPTALTYSDSINMKLPAPITDSSDRIRVSKKRLIAVLYWLGLLDDDDGKMLVAMIHQLWKETNEYSTKLDANANLEGIKKESKSDSTDVESLPELDDEVDLGALKWVIYGIPEQQPKSLFATYCMPCCSNDEDEPSPNHPAGKSGMEQHGGELVRHDIFTCPLCRNATGCPALKEHVEEINDTDHPTIQRISSTQHMNSDDESDDESSAFIEVSPQAALGSMIKEI